VWGADSAEDGIEKTVAFFTEIGMPVCFSELGIGILSDAQLDALAFNCTYGKARTIGNFMTLGYDDIRSIYSSANR
jgi:alcohol dehydrogenase YqhD (iron-dependent ADH family)